MGLSTLEKIGIGLVGAYAGSYFFPNEFYSATGGLLGSAPETSAIDSQLAASIPSAANSYSINAPTIADLSSPLAVNPSIATGAVLAPTLAANTTESLTKIPETTNPKSFGSQLVSGLTSPAGLSGLFVAGSSLATSLLQQADAKENREFQSGEAQKNRDTQISENQKGRDFSSEQAALNREQTASLAADSRAFQAEQAKKARMFEAILANQNQRNSIISQRIGGSRGNGSSLAANVANLNQSLLR